MTMKGTVSVDCIPGCDQAAGVLRTFSVSRCSKNTSILGLFGEDEKCRATMKDD